MKLKTLLLSVSLVCALGCFSSCETSKTYAYMQNVELAKRYEAEGQRLIKLQPGDRLSINIGSTLPSLAAPLNGGGLPMVSAGGATSLSGATSAISTSERVNLGYLVDQNGNIDFPMLGMVHVAGQTIFEVSESLRKQIVDKKLLADPRVSVAINNFKVYLLGAVLDDKNMQASNIASNGTGNIGENIATFSQFSGLQGGALYIRGQEGVNILEAISLIGGLPVQADMEKINVIRKVGKDYVTYRLNLKSTDLFQSPGFYLQQDDILYVDYRFRRYETLERGMTLVGYTATALSSVASVLTTILLIKNLK